MYFSSTWRVKRKEEKMSTSYIRKESKVWCIFLQMDPKGFVRSEMYVCEDV